MLEMWFDMVVFMNCGVYILVFENGSGLMVFWLIILVLIVGVFVYCCYVCNLFYSIGCMLLIGWLFLVILIVSGVIMYFLLG